MCAINHAWERSGFSKRAGSATGPPDCPDCPAPTHHFHTFKRSLTQANVVPKRSRKIRAAPAAAASRRTQCPPGRPPA